MMSALAKACRTAMNAGHIRHYGGFLVAGLAALATDALILVLLTRVGGLNPLIARPFGIAVAMIVSWLINRTVTFQSVAPPNVAEFTRFAGVSMASQIVNYGIYAALLLGFPALMPELALLLACFVSMFVSYTGFRFGVFRNSGKGC